MESKFSTTSFTPNPLAFNPTLQTIWGRFWPQMPDIKPSNQHFVELPDEDKLVLMEYFSKSWRYGDPVVILIHGLVGCYQSKYMIRMTRKFLNEGYKVFRVNLRGCGPGLKFAKGLYHSGRSEDAYECLKYVARTNPESPISLVGFSLGANISLKMAGEYNDLQNFNLKKVVAICPPVNLKETVVRMMSSNPIFNWYFVSNLLSEAKNRHKVFPQLPQIDLPKKLSLYDFDNLYLAPLAGFDSADDYYEKSSSERVFDKITIRSLILHSHDDPIVDGQYLKRIPRKENIEIVTTDHGGHVGFLDSKDFLNNFRWMDGLIINWMSSR